MKKTAGKPLVLAVLLAVIYLAGIVLGACVVISYPIYFKQKDFFLHQAQAIAREQFTGETAALDRMTSPNTHILFFDSGGTCLRHVEPTNYDPGTPSAVALEPYLPGVLSGGQIYRPVLANETARELPDIIVMTGVPVLENGSVTGAVFLLKNLMDLPAAVAGSAAYFTLFYWISALVIVSSLRKKRKLDETRRSYIANVTHALKTPVASIKALSETLCDGVEPDPDRQKVYYGMILQEANRQDRMIRDILELSKLQSSGTDFTRHRFDAAEVLAPVLDKYGTLADCMGITLSVSEEAAHLPPLYSNAACVRQILEILLDNALKFVPEGGHIRLEASAGRKQVVFCVRDDGIGIPPEVLPCIFDRFFKYSHDFNESGSGLGLAIAKELAAGLGESIRAESEPGHGAAFYFTVRLK